MFQQIIVPLDGSEEACEALGPAATLARRVGAPLHIVALHPPDADPAPLEALVLEQADETGDVIRVVEVRPIEESVPRDLRRLADRWGPSLIVMASHGRGRSAALIGSVANDILNHPGQPVMLVGPGVVRSRFRTHGPAVVSVTGEDDDVLNLAAAILAETDFDPMIANVMDPRRSRELDLVRSGPHGSDVPADSVVAERAAGRLAQATGRSAIDFDVFHDPHVADALVAETTRRRASLLIMATHARSGFERLSTGSVTAEVVRTAPCPVLVTRIVDEPER
ncbi:MAG: universal stress protein [Actinomycetota bacterium]